MTVARVLHGADVAEADFPSATAVGACVYVTGAPVSGRLQVATVNPQNLTTIPAIGIVEAKYSATTGLVRLAGRSADIYSGLTPGKQQFVALSGQLTESIGAITPLVGQPVLVQQVAVAESSTAVVVQCQAPNIHR